SLLEATGARRNLMRRRLAQGPIFALAAGRSFRLMRLG
ncbi:MAG: hypothetical protein ACI91F_003698, partial [Candidatus Binatia bacterium]